MKTATASVLLHIEGKKIVFKGSFPDLCVYCGQTKSVDKNYKAEGKFDASSSIKNELKLKLPYCKKHGEAFDFANKARTLIMGLLIVLFSFPLYFIFELLLDLGPGPALIIVGTVGAFILFVGYSLLEEYIISPIMARKHGITKTYGEMFPPGLSVRLEQSKAYFYFVNHEFAQAFAVLNREYVNLYEGWIPR